MSKQICDVCGSEFVWQKGMVYCSYDCERKARLKREQQAEAYLKKIEKETKCPACGFVGVDVERYCNDDHGIHWETFYKCKKCGRKTTNTQWSVYEPPTVFEKITASPEVLAIELVYMVEYVNGFITVRKWTSNLIEFECENFEEALAATVARLKEVAE